MKSNELINLLITGPSGELQLTDEQVKYLYGELLPGLAKRIVAVKSTKEPYVKLVADTIENLINLFNVELVRKTATLDDLADACRVLFDPTQKFYGSHNQKVFEEEPKQETVTIMGATVAATAATLEEAISNCQVPKCDLSKFSPEDKAWRNSLKAGDLIDAVKWDQNFGIKSWAKAKIENVISGYGCSYSNLGDENGVGVKTLRIAYVQDLGVPSKLVRADEPSIAQYLSKTHVDSWRDNLAKGMEVDAMSRGNSWFKSTVIEPDPRDDAVQKMAKIGFR